MEDAPLNISALLRNSDHLFDRAFQVVAVKHANGAPFTRANPPTRFRAYLNPGWISGAGGNRLIGGYTMVTCMRAALAFANSQGYPDAVSSGFDFYSYGPGGEVVEIRVMEKKRGNKFLYVDSEMRALGKKRAAKLVSLDDPDVEEKAGSWGDLSPVMGTRGIYGFLPNREKSRYLIADRLKPPALPPREDCIDLYGALGVLPFASDGKDYSPNATKPAKPSNPPIIRQTIRTDACPTSMNKAIAVAAGKNAPESLIHLNEGGHYVYTSDFRPQDALSVAYHSDMVPFEMLLQQLRDVKVQGKWLLPTTLSLQLQFYSRPTSPVLRRMLIGGLHVAEEQLGMADVEVLIWDDQTEQLVASGRQTMSMMALPQEMVDAMMKQQGVDRSVLEHGQVLTRL